MATTCARRGRVPACSVALLLCTVIVFGSTLAPASCKGTSPRPIPSVNIKSILKGIDTVASRATLEALNDATLLSPPTVGSFLKSAEASLKAGSKDALNWRAAGPYRHLLVQHLRYTRQTEALVLLRRWASSKSAPKQQQQALQRLVALLDISAFVAWASGGGPHHSKHPRDHPRATADASARQNNAPVPAPATSDPSPTPPSPPRATADATTAAAARPRPPSTPPKVTKPAPKPAPKPTPDVVDPLNQLVDWSKRLRSLGGRLDFLTKAQAPPAKANPKAPKSPFLNIGSPGFKARRIGVVFHVFQFKDSKGFIYPPQAYTNGSLPAERILAVVNQLYRYSGTNIQFYLRQYRADTKKYPYLLFQNGSDYQECAVASEGCLCRAAKKFNANSLKYINVYVVGSSAYQPLLKDPDVPPITSFAFTAAIPFHADGCAFLYDARYTQGIDGPWDSRRSLQRQFIWLNWDRLDPLADNSAAAYNQGASSLAHEFGHLLGLLHTFQGGCSDSNDAVSDTPIEDDGGTMEVSMGLCRQVAVQGRLPTRAQLKRYNSCGGDAYVDNVFNLMSYSPALCRLYLTRGQVRRMQALTRQVYKFEGGT